MGLTSMLLFLRRIFIMELQFQDIDLLALGFTVIGAGLAVTVSFG